MKSFAENTFLKIASTKEGITSKLVTIVVPLQERPPRAHFSNKGEQFEFKTLFKFVPSLKMLVEVVSIANVQNKCPKKMKRINATSTSPTI